MWWGDCCLVLIVLVGLRVVFALLVVWMFVFDVGRWLVCCICFVCRRICGLLLCLLLVCVLVCGYFLVVVDLFWGWLWV